MTAPAPAPADGGPEAAQPPPRPRSSPLHLLFGPIFIREVRAAGRRRWTYALRAIYAGLLLAVAALTVEAARSSEFGSAVARAQELQRLAPQIALVVVWFQFVVVAFMAPLIAAPAIAEERIKGTLATLLTTPLTAWHILAGKLTSRLAQLVILLTLGVPILLAVRIFGGFSASLVLSALIITASTAILGAALGLMYSIWHQRASTAALFALMTLGLIQVAPSATGGIIIAAVVRSLEQGGQNIEQFLDPISLISMGAATCSPMTLGLLSGSEQGIQEMPRNLLIPLGSPRAGTINLGPLWAWNSAYNLFWAAVVMVFAARQLRGLMLREGSGAPEPQPAKDKRRRSRRAPTPAPSPAPVPVPGDHASAQAGEPAPAPDPDTTPDHPAASAPAREVSDRPILWREVRHVSQGVRRWGWLIVTITLVTLLLVHGTNGVREPSTYAVIAVVGAIAALIQSIFTTSMAISSERESRSWDVLLATPLSARAIVLGKTLGLLRQMWFFPAVVLVDLLMGVVLRVLHPLVLVQVTALIVAPVLFFTMMGVLFSLCTRRGVTASVLNLAVALAIWAGLWVAWTLIREFGPHITRQQSESVEMVLWAISPPPMIAAAVQGADLGFGGTGARRYELGGRLEAKWMMAWHFWLMIAGSVAFYTSAAGLALQAVLSRFNRWGGRSS